MTDLRIGALTLDEHSVATRTRAIEQEREVAISDLLEKNFFKLVGSPGGPYHLTLSVEENRLVFNITLESGEAQGRIMLSLNPFRGVIKDYFLICDSYHKAIQTSQPHQIEALDMGRRGLHNEGSTLLQARLEGKIETDFDTARRLFTLICAMHLKG